MGDATSPYVPFQITYIQHEPKSNSKEFKPLGPPTIPCNQAVSVSNLKLFLPIDLQLKHLYFLNLE